jgi:hypothetical protein
MGRFDYLIEKIESAPFESAPFKHLYLESFFDPADFQAIVSSPQIALPPVSADRELISLLHENHFKEINFPGTTTDIEAYLKWHADRGRGRHSNQAICEGYGVTMRLQKVADNPFLDELLNVFRSDHFWQVCAQKFGLNWNDVVVDVGLQKYLDGYEISPHPDIRRKALTFMININPSPNSENIDYHTRYLTFKPERDAVRRLWEEDASVERCWVPWGWCDVRKTQTRNNSIVLFSPANDTIHAVKAAYDHLYTQRTQFYGNLWYKQSHTTSYPHHDTLEKMLFSKVLETA